MRRALATVTLLVGVTLAACGGDSAPMSGRAAAELRVRVDAVRAAADARDPDAAERALDTLRASVARLRRQDRLTDARAADLLAAASAVEDQLVTITTTTTTTTTTRPVTTRPATTAPPTRAPADTTPATTAAPAPPPIGDDGKGNGNGKGKGKG